jgi:hypothetical protein
MYSATGNKVDAYRRFYIVRCRSRPLRSSSPHWPRLVDSPDAVAAALARVISMSAEISQGTWHWSGRDNTVCQSVSRSPLVLALLVLGRRKFCQPLAASSSRVVRKIDAREFTVSGERRTGEKPAKTASASNVVLLQAFSC